MPTSSVAGAAKAGINLPSKVLGRAPSFPRKKEPVGSKPSFPPPNVAGRGPNGTIAKGPGQRPPPGKENPAPAESPLEVTAWGASDPAIRAQLERELGALREQLSLRQQISHARQALTGEPHSGTEPGEAVRDGHLDASIAFSDRGLDALDTVALASLAAAPPVDREAARLSKRVADFEGLIVKKLIARTPAGPPMGVGALRVFTKAFEYFDTFKDGTVTLAGLTKVLHDKINALTQLPPSQREKELIAALFAKHGGGSGATEVDYVQLARGVLRSGGTFMPADEMRERDDRDRWQYTTAVHQALDRRNLGTSQATVPMPAARQAWGEDSAAARSVEERLAYHIAPRASADGAALRGRLRGGPAGYADFHRVEAKRKESLAQARKAEGRAGAATAEAARLRASDVMREAAAGWAKIDQRNQELGGLTPGQATAAARRVRG